MVNILRMIGNVKLRLEAILQKKKISKYRLAQLLGVPTPNIFRYFKPEFDPKLSTLERLAKVLEIKVRDLLDE
jgi:DNA-binding Xre family transcriptional regulator